VRSIKGKVFCDCDCHPVDSNEIINFLVEKITSGAAELDRLLNASPMDMLSQSFYRKKPHATCEGTGTVYRQNGPDDVDKERCGSGGACGV
jgi:hypothetical protein